MTTKKTVTQIAEDLVEKSIAHGRLLRELACRQHEAVDPACERTHQMASDLFAEADRVSQWVSRRMGL